jgi:hypothetical protein
MDINSNTFYKCTANTDSKGSVLEKKMALNWSCPLTAPGHMELSDAMEKLPSDTTRDRSRDLKTSIVMP